MSKLHSTLTLVAAILGLELSSAVLCAQPRGKPGDPTPQQAGAQLAELQASLPKLEAAYLARVATARKQFDAARQQSSENPDSAALEKAMHAYNWTISDDVALGEILLAIRSLDKLGRIHYESDKPPGPFQETLFQQLLQTHRWFDSLVWANLADRPAKPVASDRGYLKKPTIKLAMCGDSITMRTRCEYTLLNHLDDRFQVLNVGRSGAGIESWFEVPPQLAIVRA